MRSIFGELHDRRPSLTPEGVLQRLEDALKRNLAAAGLPLSSISDIALRQFDFEQTPNLTQIQLVTHHTVDRELDMGRTALRSLTKAAKDAAGLGTRSSASPMTLRGYVERPADVHGLAALSALVEALDQESEKLRVARTPATLRRLHRHYRSNPENGRGQGRG